MRTYWSLLPFLFGALLFTLGVWNLVRDPEGNLRSAMHDYVRQGQEVMDEYSKRVERRMEASLESLFDELDVNDDGVIQRSEFRGVPVNMMAAMRAVDRQRPALPVLTLPSSGFDLRWWVQAIVTCQILFLVALFCLVHLQAIVFGQKPSVDLTVDYVNTQAPHVSTEEALRYTTPWSRASRYERFKLVFFVATGLVFVRIVLAVVSFTCGVFCICMAVVGGRSRYTHPRWFRFWSSLLVAAGTMVFYSLGFSRIVTHGTPASDKVRKVIVANHTCVMEVVLLFVTNHMPSFVSAVENLSIPLFPSIAKAADAILVDRDAAASRKKTIDTIKARASDPKAAPLMIFPEGTCGMQSALFQYKKGAFEVGTPVQMVCIKFPYKHFNPTWNGRIVGGNDLFDLALRLGSQFVNHVEVAYLDTYQPTADEQVDPLLYANHVQSMMANVLRCPVSNAQYADYVAIAKRKKSALR